MLGPTELGPWPVVGGPRTVFEHPFHPRIVEEDLALPGGKVLQWLRYADDRDGVEHRDGVMGICVEDGAVLLSRQYNPGADGVVWELAGGGTNPGEDYDDAVRRELMEEVGVRPATVSYLGRFLLNNRRSGWGIRTFLCTDLERVPHAPEDGEIIESGFVPFAQVERMIRDGEIENTTVLSGWALLLASGALDDLR